MASLAEGLASGAQFTLRLGLVSVRVARGGLVTARVLRLQVALAVVAALAGSVLALAAALHAATLPGETLYPEGAILQGILRLRDGQPLYLDYRLPPFNVTPYTPIYYALVGWGARLTGLGAMETLTLGRLVSTAAAIGATAVVVRLARAFGGSRRAALVAGGLFISSYVMQPWAYTARPDLLALVFSLGGLWLGLRPGRSSAVGAGFLLAAAFLTKQTHVAALGALVFTALIARHWSRAAMLAATWGTVVLGAASCLQLATAGQFLASIVSPHSQPVHLELIARNLAWFGVFSMPLCSLAALGRRGAGTPATSRVLQCYVLFSTIYALSVLGKTGSIYNHFLQLISGLAVLAAPGFDRLVALAEAAGHPRRCWRERGAPRAAIAWLVIGTGCMLCGSLLQQLTVLIYGFSGSASPALVRVIGESPGSVLTQMDSLVVVLAGKTPVAPDPLELALLAERGAWDSAPLVRAIRSREFSLIVLRGPISAAPRFEQSAWWPPDVQAAIRGSYRPIGQVDGRYLYAPRPTMKRLDQRNL